MNNFRNFSMREVSFDDGINLIIAKNGSGKTNILEALSYPSAPLVETQVEYLVKKWETSLFVEVRGLSNKISYSYEIATKKRQYLIESKSTTKQKVKILYPHIISFHPMLMNLPYLWPSERRKFLDEILVMTFPEYKNILRDYKKILLNRNRVLKNISEGKSSESELDFWDTQYVDAAQKVYTYRKKIIEYFGDSTSQLLQYFFWKVEKIEFIYISKTPLVETKDYLQNYISKNRTKEILLRKTLRWPHLDDFEIRIDTTALTHFASRWEVKSVLIWMKLLEKNFVEQYSDKTHIVYLIDDLLSELDTEHRNMLLENIKGHQSIITSIEDINIHGKKIFI